MSDEKMILKKLEEMSKTMTEGFSDINGRFGSMEKRLKYLEDQSVKNYQRQRDQNRFIAEQSNELSKLKKIVQRMADESPCRELADGTAIYKEPAYEEFGEAGFRKRQAMKTLRDGGVIRTDSEGKTTCSIRIGGRVERVIIVCADREGSANG